MEDEAQLGRSRLGSSLQFPSGRRESAQGLDDREGSRKESREIVTGYGSKQTVLARHNFFGLEPK